MFYFYYYLIVMETQFENDKVIDEVLSLYFGTLKISNLIKNTIPNPVQFNTYVLIDKDWLDQYKLSCNYSELVSLIKSKYTNLPEKEIQKQLKSTGMKYDIEKRKEILSRIDFIKPQLSNEQLIKYPKNFAVIREEFFQKLLLNYTPKENNDNFKECYYKALIGDDCIIFKSNGNQEAYLICIINICNKDYNYSNDLDYLLIFDKNNKTTIYNEIKEHIQGKGFTNYIHDKDINSSRMNQMLFNNQKEQIGIIINLKHKKENSPNTRNEISNNLLKENNTNINSNIDDNINNNNMNNNMNNMNNNINSNMNNNMNSNIKYILLCLLNIPDLQVYFSNCNRNSSKNQNEKLFLYHFFTFFSSFQDNPIKILEDLEQFIFSLKDNRKNQKNYNILTDFIYNELDINLSGNRNNIQNSEYEFDEKKSKEAFESQNKKGSIIQELFYITLEKEIKYLCNDVIYHFNFIRMLIFDIEDWSGNTLSSAINPFFKKQNINTDNKKKFCKLCSKVLGYSEKDTIIKLPKILTVVLEGKYKNGININLFNDLNCEINDSYKYYTLTCFINENDENKYEVLFQDNCYWLKYDESYNRKYVFNQLYFKPRVCFYSEFDNNILNNQNNPNDNEIYGVRDTFLLFTSSNNKRQVFLDVNPNMIFIDAVEELKDKYDWLEKEASNAKFIFKGKEIKVHKTIKDNKLKSNDEIMIKAEP